MSTRSREEDRLNLLRKELRLAGVSLRQFLPLWAQSDLVCESILSELLVALEAPVHEGFIPPSGSLFVPKSAELSAVLPLEDKDIDLARKAANGSSALLAFRETRLTGLLLLDPSSAPVLQLARLARTLDGVAILRDRHGIVRLYGPSTGSLQHTSRRWSISPSISDAMERTCQAAPMVDRELLFKLLELAHYVLSPWHIGATLIWRLSDRNPLGRKRKVDLRPLRLSVSPEAGAPTLAFAAHLLAQYDGATVVSPSGHLVSTGIHLTSSSKAESLLRARHGARHTSALRTSYDHSDTLVITVSSDGPVTVFSDGLNIFELGWFSADEFTEEIGKLSGQHPRDVMSAAYEMTCPNCGKTSCIERLTVVGWRDHEAAHCRVCMKSLQRRIVSRFVLE
jgi:DNA integrity scanning protein DisA with diadenylate cyclase activity